MDRTLPIAWFDVSPTRRAAHGLGVLTVLSLADLTFTLWAHAFTPFHELNPIASALLDRGLLAVLVSMKLLLTATGVAIFWRLRGNRRAEVAMWAMVLTYVLLTLRWSDYVTSVSALVPGGR